MPGCSLFNVFFLFHLVYVLLRQIVNLLFEHCPLTAFQQLKDSGAGQYRNNSSRYDFPDPFHLCSLSMSSFIVLHLCSDTIFQYLADLDISRNAS